MMAKVSELAGLSCKYTNHSLCVTATTRMLISGLPEMVIAEFMEHKTVRQYKRTSMAQEQAAGNAIALTGEPKPYSNHCNEAEIESKHAASYWRVGGLL